MVILKLKKINFTTAKVNFLEDVDIVNVLVSYKISSGGKNFKYFITYNASKSERVCKKLWLHELNACIFGMKSALMLKRI